MRTTSACMLLAAALTALQSVTAGDGPPANPRVIVDLADGSRLVGTMTATTFPIRSEALGRMQVPLDTIRAIKFSPDHESVALLFQNGDNLQGFIGTEMLVLRTLVGEIKIPLALAAGIEVVPVEPDPSLKTGLVAYYPFNGDANDHSGSGNHGRVVGAVFESQGLRLKGDTSSYVVVRRSDSLEPAEAITISMWVKGVPGQEAGHGWGTVLRKMDNCRPGYGVRGGGVSSFSLAGENPCAGGRVSSAAFRPFTPTRWQHIAATYARAEEAVRTYQDGEIVNQMPATHPLLHSGELYLGGAAVAGDDGGFRGLIREVRIYNRALSAAEIRALSVREPGGR